VTTDIRPYGTGDGKGSYWVKRGSMFGWGTLVLVVIDEYGEVQETPMRGPWDPDAPTQEQAVEAHLAGLVKQADRQLERFRQDQPPKPPEPPPLDYATRKFLSDDEGLW
jgi:hypothetical protein